MRSIRFEGYCGPWMTRTMQKQRLLYVIDHELTDCQRRAIRGYYYEGKTIPELAQEYGVNKSTICRTLHRAEARMKRLLKF